MSGTRTQRRAAATDTRRTAAAVKCLYHTKAVSYGTVMGALHGIHFQRATKLLICFNWFMLMVSARAERGSLRRRPGER